MREISPFQRKERVGNLRWYENIRMSYTGTISNSIQNVSESGFFQNRLIGDWKNGIQHQIPISASFNLFKNITITPRVNYTERWYTTRIDSIYNMDFEEKELGKTTSKMGTGFYPIRNFSAGIDAQTTLYGTYKPWKIFGKWTEKTVIRHVMKPNVSFTGMPDFSDNYYINWHRINNGRVDTIPYSPFAHNLWGVPGRGKTGTLGIRLDNNLEMRIPIAGTDSTRKVSLIDHFGLSTGYNFLADSLNWNNINASLRIKFPAVLKNYTLTLSGVFDVYRYGENGRPINSLRWQKDKWDKSRGRSIGRFQGTSQTVSFSLNNETFKKWFTKGDKGSDDDNLDNEMIQSEIEETDATAIEGRMNAPPRSSLRKGKEKDTNYDHDGYYLVNIPWNININYSFGFAYDRANFNKNGDFEYPYKITQNLGISGNISPTKNWSFTFNTGYDFDNKQFTPTQLSITRRMHCWAMSASVIPVGPYQSYSFTIAVSSPLLQDLKYNQSSNFRDAMYWGY